MLTRPTVTSTSNLYLLLRQHEAPLLAACQSVALPGTRRGHRNCHCCPIITKAPTRDNTYCARPLTNILYIRRFLSAPPQLHCTLDCRHLHPLCFLAVLLSFPNHAFLLRAGRKCSSTPGFSLPHPSRSIQGCGSRGSSQRTDRVTMDGQGTKSCTRLFPVSLLPR